MLLFFNLYKKMYNVNIIVGGNMKNKKGFTLVELLAVIVILSLILIVAGYNALKNINDSKEKAKFIAAKDIATIALTYMEEANKKKADIKDLIKDGYLEQTVTNPLTGKEYTNSNTEENQQYVILDDNFEEQQDYKIQNCEYENKTYSCYKFNGYAYLLEEN